MNTKRNHPLTPRGSNPNPAHSRRPCLRGMLALLAFAALAGQFLFVTSLQAQESLRDTLRTRGVDWIVGDWRGTNDQGQPITIDYEWELEGHLLEIDLTVGDGAYKGTILRRPDDGTLVEVGADNGSGVTHSTWEVQDGAFISKRTGTSPGGQVSRIAVKNEKVDADNVVATVHTLTPEGELGEEALDTVRLTRGSRQEDED